MAAALWAVAFATTLLVRGGIGGRTDPPGWFTAVLDTALAYPLYLALSLLAEILLFAVGFVGVFYRELSPREETPAAIAGWPLLAALFFGLGIWAVAAV